MAKIIKFIKVDNPDITKKQLEADLELELGKDVTVLRKNKLTGFWKIEVNEDVDVVRLNKASDKMKKGNIDEVLNDFKVTAFLDKAVNPTTIRKTRDQLGLEGEGMVIGICDTGVDKNHGDLKGRILGTKDFTGEGDWDGHGHGTHVMGIAIGNGTKSNGQYVGAAPKAKGYMAKGLDRNGSGNASDIADGLEWLVSQGVDIISLSLGGQDDGTKDILQLACEAAVDLGIPVFCAAGNEGPGSRTIGTPAVNERVITVGATNDNDDVTSFSSRGPTRDGRIKPDVSCPGQNIISTRGSGTSMGTPLGPDYTSASGTSMATPLEAGVGLLVLEDRRKKLIGVTPEDLKDLLRTYADFVDESDSYYEIGWGRTNCFDTIEESPTKTKPEPPNDDGGSGTPCFLTRALGANHSLLPVLRVFRDDVLDRNSFGRSIIKMYYRL